MTRQPVIKKAKPVKEEVCAGGVKTFILFSRDQATALLNHLSHARSKLNEDEQQAFDKGPLGQTLRYLRGG